MAEVIDRGGATELVPRLGVGRLLDRVATGFTMLGGLTFCALILPGRTSPSCRTKSHPFPV